ncbi:unnamed protein product [Schistocephalus solidus]|uniref:Uncharacterized protein n=1 Tax=Schistocephalus solidus TaxID=70667 RepID=A0A183SWP1_SCHSO|nr:unnamed protein product [Schistocephalus solidus]
MFRNLIGKPVCQRIEVTAFSGFSGSGRTLIREECLGDRKPTKCLRRMQTHRDELHIDVQLFKETPLERLPTDVQTILASG